MFDTKIKKLYFKIFIIFTNSIFYLKSNIFFIITYRKFKLCESLTEINFNSVLINGKNEKKLWIVNNNPKPISIKKLFVDHENIKLTLENIYNSNLEEIANKISLNSNMLNNKLDILCLPPYSIMVLSFK